MSAVAVTLFLGGPSGPALGFLPAEGTVNVWLVPVFWFVAKVLALSCGTFWLRASLPRLRYDQLMALGWKCLIEIAFLWFLVSAAIVVAPRAGLERAPGRGGRRGRGPGGLRRAVARHAEVGRAGGGVPLMGRFTGFAVTFRQMFRPRVTTEYPDEKRPKPRPTSTVATSSTATRTAWRSASGASCAPASAPPAASTCGAPTTPRRPGVAGRAVRLRLRDQLPALHPLRPVRGGVPDGGDHRDEALRVLLHRSRTTRSTPRTSCWSTTTAGARRQPWELARRRGRRHQRVDARDRPRRGRPRTRASAVGRRARLRRALPRAGPAAEEPAAGARPRPVDAAAHGAAAKARAHDELEADAGTRRPITDGGGRLLRVRGARARGGARRRARRATRSTPRCCSC